MASAGSEDGVPIDDYESLIGTTDVELLKKAWRHEKVAPEILRFETSLVQRSREQIQLMEETVEEFAQSGVDPLTVSLYQMDLDRTQFLLRSYLRVRLQKIEKYMFYILKTDLWNRLSEQEQKFAKRCTDDMGKHLDQSVLSKLPEGYKSILKQSTASENDDMIPEPKLGTFVICRSNGDIGTFELDDSDGVPLELLVGDLNILRYKSIKPLVESGQVDLV
uniref:DNA replication complex GINS protein SLD5 n=1 Tax=Kalanchoe fedtschenkoi TaxID=63787 RepID=A0A7N0VHH2_KALFE